MLRGFDRYAHSSNALLENISLVMFCVGSKLQQQLTKAKDAVRKFQKELEKMTPSADCMYAGCISDCVENSHFISGI